jgi:hypothetical protein
MRAGRLLSGAGQRQCVGGALGSAPSLLRSVTDVTALKTFHSLGLNLTGVCEEFVNPVLD